MKRAIIHFLSKPVVYKVLIAVNILVILLVFLTGFKISFPDEVSYWNMAKSIGQGRFSSWFFLPIESHETLRTWGYPFLLFLSQKISDSTTTIKIIQLLMHFAIIAMILRIIFCYTPTLIYRNIFLLLLIPNVQIVFYASQVSSETSTNFFLTGFVYIWQLFSDTWKKYILMAILAFFVFQLRPVFMLFPFGILFYKLLFERKRLFQYTVFCMLFGILLLPFGFWNKKHHGVFKLTPLEGGAGIAHSGFWQFRMPSGYMENYYWGNVFLTDLTQPTFASLGKKEEYKQQYENEMDDVIWELKRYNEPEDSVSILLMEQNDPGQYLIHNSRYTIAREKLLLKKTINNIRASPGYYIKTRIYTLFRVWYIGVNAEEFRKASWTGKLKVMYPFLVTFIFILGGLIFIFASIALKRLSWKQYWLKLLLVLYFGIMHVPFVIQSRYTVPVHLFILSLVAITLGNWLLNKKNQTA